MLDREAAERATKDFSESLILQMCSDVACTAWNFKFASAMVTTSTIVFGPKIARNPFQSL